MKGKLALELMGAAVGAGLASGRELASFFGQYGPWGYGGVAAAVIVFALLADARPPHSWLGRLPEKLWQGLSSLLLMATGGAMLAGAGEVVTMLLPAASIRWVGMGLTLFLAWQLAQRSATGLAWVSGVLLVGLGMLLAAGFALPSMGAVPAAEASASGALLRGLTYGGFNAALVCPLIGAASGSAAEKKNSLHTASIFLAALLCAGLTVLNRHPAMLGEPMPFVRMAAAYGKAGQGLAACCLYLATLSTLTACIRSLAAGRIALVGIAAFAMMGFSGVVGAAYPLLGAGCVIMLAAMGLAGRKAQEEPC